MRPSYSTGSCWSTAWSFSRLLLACFGLPLCTQAAAAASFVRLVPLPAPAIVASATEYPGGNYPASHLLDGQPRTEFSSDGAGTNTFVEFEWPAPQRIAGVRHVDRNDPATVAASELVFLNASGQPIRTVPIAHANRRGGVTFVALPEPVIARRLRWRITGLGPDRHGTVGGAEIAFFSADEPESSPRGIGIEVWAQPAVERRPEGLTQRLRVTVDYPYATPADGVVRVEGLAPAPVRLELGSRLVELTMPAPTAESALAVAVEVEGRTVASRTLPVKPPRQLTIYLLPHSHTDIGYTEIQTAIEEKQVNNLRRGMELARQTAGYPEGARFVWNVEVLWAADLYLRRLGPEARTAFREAVRRGEVALNGMYLNELTGLCRPEELIRLFRLATELAEETGVPIHSAMISDVPGYTWATVTAMAQAGIRYLSVAPNYFDRIGDILQKWENQPFYWVSPSGKQKVLVWLPWRGYALSHIVHRLTPQVVDDYQRQLEQTGYPFDVAYLRWAGHGDNAVPEASICDFVRDWNARYAWPRFVISSTTEAFAALEQRHGPQIREVRGDWTPYWEDGAGSSSLETALNRLSSDRVTQAEALWAMLDPGSYPKAAFEEAWRSVLLYSEHTWGAWCSVSEPARQETLEQWSIKRGYAAQADGQSRELLSRALALVKGPEVPGAIDVYNPSSWSRTERVVVPRDFCEGRDRVTDDQGRPLASQRLVNGDLVVQVRDLPPFAGRRFTLSQGAPHMEGEARARGAVLENDRVHVVLNEQTGALAELRLAGRDHNLVDTSSGQGLNDYLYFIGDDAEAAQRNGPVRIRVKEQGPLVASLLVEADAPGCHRLIREIRLMAGQDHVELLNVVDKARLRAGSYHAKEGKESLNFAFPFDVPGGQVRLEVPFGVLRPDADQIPSACKNWFTVGRWADVSNDEYGVTWVTLDAPLVQVGGLTANLLNSQSNPDVWRKEVGPTQRFYSWAMNNHWGTNYRAYQEGPVSFRFVLWPHAPYNPLAASRLAIAQTQPLAVTRGRGPKPDGRSRLRLSSDQVLVTGLKPADDGKGWILRLWGGAGVDASTRLEWSDPQPTGIFFSATGERAGQQAQGDVSVPAWDVVTLRAERSGP